MKKTGFMIVYNDADYVDQAISSVKDWVDELVIVEGAFKITMATGKPARSDDGTLELINKHVDNEKVFLKQANLQEHKHHYDIGYQHAIKNGSDWAILIDSDEIWTDAAKSMADVFMKMTQRQPAAELRVDEYCFINDFQTWYPGMYPRVFRCMNGAKFVFDNEVQFPGFERGQHFTKTIPGRNIFHYGYVRRKKRWELKQDYMWEKDQNPNLKNYKLEGNTYILPSDIPIYDFSGEHPPQMKEHPFYGLSAEEIIYGEG